MLPPVNPAGRSPGAAPDPGAPHPAEAFIPDLSEGAETGVYLALLELLDEGLIITGDEIILDANSAACRLLDRDYRQIAGRPLAELARHWTNFGFGWTLSPWSASHAS